MVIRAATEQPMLTRALGIDVDRWLPPVFAFCVDLAGLACVIASPMRTLYPVMGAHLIITPFAHFVIGGMGSILGSVVTGFVVGVLAALEALRTLHSAGYETFAPIEVVNWTNEEGARFAPAMIASGVFAGVFTRDWAAARADGASPRPRPAQNPTRPDPGR